MRKAFLSLCLLILSLDAYACYYASQSREAKVASAEKVFLGSLEKAEIHGEGPLDKLKLTFVVEESFKGDVGKREVVYSGLGGGDCGIGAAGFHSSMLIFTDAKSRTGTHNGSFSMVLELTESGEWKYLNDELEWLKFLRDYKSSNKPVTATADVSRAGDVSRQDSD